jgi:WhiB family redox-sensing transcriptional regulator
VSAYDAFAIHDGGLTFAERLARPAWQADGLCHEYPARWWFPERGEDSTRAIAVCNRCASRDECLEYALSDVTIVGIWGGTTTRGRLKLRKAAGLRPTAQTEASERRDRVRELVSAGYTSTQIAERLGCTEQTVQRLSSVRTGAAVDATVRQSTANTRYDSSRVFTSAPTP